MNTSHREWITLRDLPIEIECDSREQREMAISIAEMAEPIFLPSPARVVSVSTGESCTIVILNRDSVALDGQLFMQLSNAISSSHGFFPWIRQVTDHVPFLETDLTPSPESFPTHPLTAIPVVAL